MKASHLHLAYGTKVIYDDCNFHLEAGDKVGVIGVNGAGKTTLFRIILGEQQLDDGEIELPELRLGYLPQEITVPPEHENITVWDYVASGRPVDDLQNELNQEYEKLAKYPDSTAILDRITRLQDLIDSYDLANFDYELLKILEKMNLGDLSDRKLRELSGGQKSKVAFARVLFENAGLLLLDEPTNHFDPDTQKIIGENLKDYPGTIIMVSHNPAFVEQIGITRMLIIPSRQTQPADQPETPTKSKLTKTGSNEHLPIIKNYSHELLEYYYYLNSDLV